MGNGCIEPLFWPMDWLEVSGQLHAPAAFPREKSPRTGGWLGAEAGMNNRET
jgi:hypothetical protein